MSNIQNILLWVAIIIIALILMKFIFKMGVFILIVAGVIYLLMRLGGSAKKS
jgi:hypothetical protein